MDFNGSLADQVAAVHARHRDIPDHRRTFPWLLGHLGNPDAAVWFIGLNPSAKQVGLADLRGSDSDLLQWSQSAGDKRFRKNLVVNGFKEGEPLSRGGWRCYITDLMKADVNVGEWNELPTNERNRLIRPWVEVFAWEVAHGQPKMLVPMGGIVTTVLPLFLDALRPAPSVYPGQLWHYAFRIQTAANVAKYEQQFRDLSAYARDKGWIHPTIGARSMLRPPKRS